MATIWRGGCIIRARFLDRIKQSYDDQPDLRNLLFADYFADAVGQAQDAWRRVVATSAEAGVPAPAFSSSLAYYDQLRRDRSSAALIQGLRDFFGAHTYRRIDDGARSTPSGPTTGARSGPDPGRSRTEHLCADGGLMVGRATSLGAGWAVSLLHQSHRCCPPGSVAPVAPHPVRGAAVRDLESPTSDPAAMHRDRQLLRLSTSHDSRHGWIEMSGELDLSSAPMLDEAIERLRQDGYGATVILDMRQLTFVDCAGLGVLIRHHGEMRDEGGRLVLMHPPRVLRRLLALTGLTAEFHVR